MLLLSYVKKHLFLHVVSFVMYGALFFLMLLVIGEIIYENGYDHLSVEDTTYTFRLYTNDRQKTESIIKSIDNYSDILVASENEDYILVSFLTQVSNERTDDMVPSLHVNPGEIAYNSQLYFYDVFDEAIDSNNNAVLLGDQEFEIVGRQSLGLYLPVELWKVLYLNSEDFWNMASSDNILLSIYKDERMSDSELEVLNNLFADNDITSVNYLPDRKTSASRIISSDEVRLIYIMVLLSCLCYARLMLMLIVNRSDEYRIMRYCGANKIRVARYIFNHVLFVLILSAFCGTVLYWVIAAFSSDLFSYGGSAFAFYLLVLAGYLAAALMTSGLFILAKAAKDGY